MNNTAINIHVQVFACMFLILLSTYLGVELSGLLVTVFYLLRNSPLWPAASCVCVAISQSSVRASVRGRWAFQVSKAASPFMLPPGDYVFTSSPTSVSICCSYCCYFYDNCPSGWKTLSHSGFDLHFPYDWWSWALFHVFIGHLYNFWGEMSSQTLFLFLNWIICLFVIEL